MPIQGPTNSNFDLVDGLKQTFSSVSSLRDSIGAKLANVWLYRKAEGEEPVWKQLLPTPEIMLSQQIRLEEGGAAEGGDIQLRGIPIENFTREQLDTREEVVTKYIVIAPPNEQTIAFTTVEIERKLLSYSITLTRFKGVNPGELDPTQ